MTTKVRFAPSPTGFLHVGNIRTAIINFLFAKKTGGEFYLRLDDTDTKRVQEIYRQTILQDISWLQLNYHKLFKQSDRLAYYEKAKQQLLQNGRLYECFETEEELNLQRKSQISSGAPPIYNRASLQLTSQQKSDLRKQGLKPHYRFLLKDEPVSWQDQIKGKITYEGRHFSDPVLFRQEDETGATVPTYTFCSVVDDIDYNITHIIRGEDHVTNTAIQIQIFQALNAQVPLFAHLALIKASTGKISKREGGFDIKTMRENGYDKLTILAFLAKVGTSCPITSINDISQLVENFDFSNFSKSATNYDFAELNNFNQKTLQNLSFSAIQDRLQDLNISNITEQLWEDCKKNINFLPEIKQWQEIFNNPNFYHPSKPETADFLNLVSQLLPENTSTSDAWHIWLNNIKQNTSKQGKEIFLPIRMALTGLEHGPELKHIINLIPRKQILFRLTGNTILT
jgi:glutamyl-tRNA synthetase